MELNKLLYRIARENRSVNGREEKGKPKRWNAEHSR